MTLATQGLNGQDRLNQDACTKTVNFLTPRVRILTKGCGKHGHSVNVYNVKKSYSLLLLILKKTDFKLRKTINHLLKL